MEEEFLLNGKTYTKSQLGQYAKKSGLSIDKYIYESGATKKESKKNYVLNGKNYDKDQLSQYAKKSGLTLDEYIYEAGVKKKEPSEPTSQEEPLVSPAKQVQQDTSLDTEPPTRAAASVTLGGPTKLFEAKKEPQPESIMYGAKQPDVLVPSKPLDEKPKKYYRVVSDELKNVTNTIKALEDKNLKAGRSIEEIQSDGTYQYLKQKKDQLDQEFKPAEAAIKEIKKETTTWTRPIERIISSATDGKYSLANTETIRLNKDVEDRIIDSFDDAPEEVKQKWYKGSLPLDQKENIINTAKIDVLNNTFNSLKQETGDYIKNIKDNPNIPETEKIAIRNKLKAKSDAFNAQVALDFSGNLLKNNFKKTEEDKKLDEAIFSKYEGFIPETADMVSRFVEGVVNTAGKAITGIPTLALLGSEKFNQITGASKPEDYTPIEATIDLINDTTNYNWLPSSKSEKGDIVDKEGNLNLSYRSITRTLADTLPFTLQIINSVKKGRVEGSPQSMVSQLINPSKNKAFSDNLRAAETAYKVTIGDNYREAKDLGMDDSKAFTYANVMSLAEGVSESIMPDFKYFDSLTGSTLKNVFKGSLKEATTKQAVKNVTKDFFKNIGSEIGEEEFSLAVEDGLKYSLLLNHKNSEFFNIKKQKELIAATVIMSGSIGSVAIPGKFKQNKTDIYREMYNNIGDLQDSFNNEINSPLNNEETKQTFRDTYKFASDVSNAIAKSPENVTSDQVDLLVQKNKLEEKKKNIDAAFHPDINEEISAIDTKIRELAKTPVVEEAIKPIAEEVTVETPEVTTTTEEVTIKDSQIPLKRETFESETDSGTPITIEVTTNKDGSRTIVTKVEGSTSTGETVSKDNTLSTEEYITSAYGDIKGEAKVEQGIDIMAPAMKEKLTTKQKQELGIVEETKPTTTSVEYNGVQYSKNENNNWVNNNTGNEIKGIGEKGKQLIKALDDLSTTVATEVIQPSEIATTLDEVITPASNNIKEQISRAKKAISKLLPNVEIIYHDTAESFNTAVGDNSRGAYIDRKIHINGSNADSTTVAHEVFHAVLLNYIKDGGPAADITNRMFKALSGSLKGNPKLLNDINEFAKNYDKGIQNEEKLAEIIGYLVSEYDNLPTPSKNIIKRWLENIAVMLKIKPFTDSQVIDFMNTLAGRVREGQIITETDVEAINQGLSTYISEPTEILRSQNKKEEKVIVGDHKLSFVKQSDIIDFDSLLRDISNKKEKVWFWVADQLGRGDYYDSVINGQHYLDAGPSFALDPKNRNNNIIWATGKPEREITKLINNSDYIFIISGSPTKSKLFNKSIIDIISKRVGDFNSFKENITKVSKIKSLNEVLSSVNSWEELRETPKRKDFLLDILNQASKNTPLKEQLEKYNAIVDLNELRDGFYADNNFDLNDVMLVLKPTEFGGKSDHSTYENNILGKVVGVPDIKVDAFDLMPSELKDKYKKELGKSMKQQVVAPYGIGIKIIERRQISPENSSNYANMTEDGKGNFVFYHYGPRGIKSIDPKKYGSNKGAITSKPEIAAMGRVGGMAQFYTNNNFSESNVTGDKYMIKVPMDKVYDFNTDPDNLYDKAKELFKKKNPNLPFTANDQLAYITKLAERAGYMMSVAEWNGMSRAQSTMELKPVDTQVMDGNTITKPFNEDYESNVSKGFKSVVPVSKEEKLKEVYNKIYRERNSKNKYDDLYRLEEDFPKLSQDEITTMIEESDISQEMKDAYAEALAYEPGTRMSERRQVDVKAIAENTKSEVDRIKALPISAEDGATFNLDGAKYDGVGLVVPMKSLEGNTTQEKLSPEMIGKFTKENEENISDESMVKMGIYKFPDKVDVSVDINIVIPNENRDVALEFGRLIGQKSLFDLNTFEYVETGADGLNPMDLTAEQFREAATSLKNGVMPAFVSGRRQAPVSPIDTAVQTAKQRGFDDKKIIEYLITKGYTRKQASLAILRYNSITSVALRKKDQVFTTEGRNKVVSFLDSMKRRVISAKSFIPKSAFLLQEKSEAYIEAEVKNSSYLVKDYERLIKNYDGDVDALTVELDKYMRGDNNAVVPDEFKAVIGKIRMHIDNISNMLISSGAVTDEQADTIRKNLGQYINRSYEVFDNNNWKDKVTEEMKEAVRTELRNIFKANVGRVTEKDESFDASFTYRIEREAEKTGMDIDLVIEKFIENQIDDLLKGKSAETFLGVGKIGSKDTSIMREKTDIPLSIRQLMGEYTDVAQNYSRTILKLATYAENAKYLKAVRDAGMGVYFYNEGDLNKPAEFNVKIAGDNSKTMNPLNGLYTTKEIAKAFETTPGIGDLLEIKFGVNAKYAYEYYMKVVSTVKWLKTIASVGTHAKNILGNVWFMLSNGYIDPRKYSSAFSVLANSSNEDLRAKLDEYIRAGIVNQSATLNEVRAMFSDANFETAVDRKTKKNVLSIVKAGFKGFGGFLNRAYQAEDDFFKIVAYETEKSRYAKAFHDTTYDNLSADQKESVKDYSAEIVKNVLPNYGRVPNAVKFLRIVPIAGTFISFQAEAYRTAWNTVALAADELKSSNKSVKAIGAIRLSGIVAAQAFKFGLMTLLGKALMGGDDDEDKLGGYVRRFVAPWSKDSDIVVVKYGNGKMVYIDFSASDPHGGIKKAVNAAMSGEDFGDAFAKGVGVVVEPFVKEDIFKELITDIVDNKNAFGGKLYNEQDSNVNKVNAIMARVYKTFEPGSMSSVRKIFGSEDKGNEALGQLTGYKNNTVDVNMQLGFKMSELKRQVDEAKMPYNAAFRKYENGEVTYEEYEAAYTQANIATKAIYSEMYENLKAASFFGVDDDSLTKTMEDSRLSKKLINSLYYGELPDVEQKETASE